MGRNGTEVFGKVFLAILVLFVSFSKAQYSFTCVSLLLELVLEMVLLGGNVMDGATRGLNFMLR